MGDVMIEMASLQPKAAFWRFLENGEIRFQHCDSCGTPRWPARSRCHKCLSPEFTWTPAAEEGTVLTYIVVNRTYVPGREVPFTLVHAQLDDGVRYTGKLAKTSSGEIAVGSRVRVALNRDLELPEPEFELAGAGGPR
jgi:uncharacterized OB-fold protein